MTRGTRYGGEGEAVSRATLRYPIDEVSATRTTGEQIKAVSFDAYGTLLYLDRPFERLGEELRRVGLDVPMQIVTKVFVEEMTYYRAHHLEGNSPDRLLSLRHRCAEVLFGNLAQEGYAARMSEEQKLRVLMGAIRLCLYEDALPALDWCLSHGLATCVVSDWDCSLPEILEQLCPRPFSSVIVSACEGIEKPDPALFLKAAERLSLSPPQIVHIGDEVENDLHGAKQAGLKPVLIDRGRAHGDIGSFRIESLRDFPSLIERAFEFSSQT